MQKVAWLLNRVRDVAVAVPVPVLEWCQCQYSASIVPVQWQNGARTDPKQCQYSVNASTVLTLYWKWNWNCTETVLN